MTDIVKALSSLAEGKPARLALSAFAIDSLLALVALIIVSGTSLDKQFAISSAPYPFIAISMYIVFFFIIWFILWMQVKNQNEDGYTPVRKKLEGMWLVEYGSPYGNNFDRRIAQAAVGSTITINPANRKLEISFRIKDNRIFADDEKQTIKIISLRHDKEYDYNLFYYFKGKRDLQSNIKNLLLPELGHNLDGVEIEFLARLDFSDSNNELKILKMSGQWYDLNGNMSKLLALVSEIDDAQRRDGKLTPRMLSDIGVPAFSASMGNLDFIRSA